ncbi:MAG: PhoH family protein [Clostridia bacterium]|nr:PhoH family protein [Clostridia bacterium]MBR4979812.1 PhoH family protein [Clostridia bacterium]
MTEKLVKIASTEKTAEIFGDFDANTKIIESEFGVRLFQTSEGINVIGDEPSDVEQAANAIEYLLKLSENHDVPNEQTVRYVISMVNSGSAGSLQTLDGDCICITSRGKPVKAKTVGQKQYIDSISQNTLTFAIGPAGTGKTFLAVAMAVNALRAKQVTRIILTRPAVEAGERLGFLPGDLQSKIDPYLRPLYDALFQMLGMDGYTRNLEKGAIEIAPLAYMRGRTLDDSFIILDEAQNTTPEQMKMFLTRLGFGSKVVVTGDITQIDLPRGVKSGLSEAVKILENIPGISVFYLTSKDIVRHSLVQKIINAYENYENNKKVEE